MNSAAFRIILTKVRWLVYETGTSCFDFGFWLFHFPVPGMVKRQSSGIRRVVFVGELLPPRTSRMAKWLYRSGSYSAVLVCSKRGFVEKFSGSEFDGIYLFRNKWHLKRILRAIPGVSLLHSFAPKSYFPDIARETLNVPFIHDMQDVYATYYGLTPSLRWLKKELPHERNCLEKADGLVAHSLEPNVAYRKYHTPKKPPSLFFPLYCDDDSFLEVKKAPVSDEIHLVYAGGVAGSHRNPKQYGSIQFQGLIKQLSAQKIHFHIYPSPSNVRADYEEYEVLDGQNPYFHFHQPVAQQDLAGELNKYDWGILPFFAGQNEQSPDKYKYATTLKVFNYLEAGLPVIVSKDIIYQCWIIERYGYGIGISGSQITDLRSLITPLVHDSMLKNIPFAREKLSLKNNIPRLEAFYDEILAKS